MKMRNLVREKIAQNGYALGAFVASSSAMNCEILGLNRLDFVIIDCEHAETNTETIVHMCRASELCGVDIVVVEAPAGAAATVGAAFSSGRVLCEIDQVLRLRGGSLRADAGDLGQL